MFAVKKQSPSVSGVKSTLAETTYQEQDLWNRADYVLAVQIVKMETIVTSEAVMGIVADKEAQP